MLVTACRGLGLKSLATRYRALRYLYPTDNSVEETLMSGYLVSATDKGFSLLVQCTLSLTSKIASIGLECPSTV